MKNISANTTIAAAVTPAGTAAIAAVRILGKNAGQITAEIFKPKSGTTAFPKAGSAAAGLIMDGEDTVDEAVAMALEENHFQLCCHGNAIIIETVMEILRQKGAVLVSTADYLRALALRHRPDNVVAAAAYAEKCRAVSLKGAELIEAQSRESGLFGVMSRCLDKLRLGTGDLKSIKNICSEILDNSARAELLIKGISAVIAGPVNSGKSTLFNALCKKNMSLTAPVKGTTRDYVCASVSSPEGFFTFCDTAGLDSSLDTEADRLAQQISEELVEKADAVLLVLDGSERASLPDNLKKHADKIITVINKTDLPEKIEPADFADYSKSVIRTSAKNNIHIDSIPARIADFLGIADLDVAAPAAFTQQQKELLQKIIHCTCKEQAKMHIEELLFDSF